MPPSLRRHSLMLSLLAVAFALFFESSKHDSNFAKVNPFAEDPYDAVASFAVQFVLFVAAVSVLRAFRPYPAKTDLSQQAVVVARGQFMGLLAVAVTVVVDGIAMFRHQSMWKHTTVGRELVVLAAGFFLWAMIAAVLLVRTFSPDSCKGRHRRIQAGIAAFVVSIPCWYPENLRQGLGGAIFTVLVGAAILFIPIKELAEAIGPSVSQPAAIRLDR